MVSLSAAPVGNIGVEQNLYIFSFAVGQIDGHGGLGAPGRHHGNGGMGDRDYEKLCIPVS